MADNVVIVGCHFGNRVKSKYLFSSLGKFNDKRSVLTSEQKDKIKQLYKDKKIKYRRNSSSGGIFGMYFNVIPDWNEKRNNMYFIRQNRSLDYLSIDLKCCYYYNAKKLIMHVVNDMVDREVSLENMIYFNIGHIHGEINEKTILFKFTGKENIEQDTDIFLLNIIDIIVRAGNGRNELIIKWLIPKTAEYGFMKKKTDSISRENRNPCYHNSKDNLSNEVFFEKYGSRNIEDLMNSLNNDHPFNTQSIKVYDYDIKKWLNELQIIYKEEYNKYKLTLNKPNKTNHNIAIIENFENLEKMLQFISNDSILKTLYDFLLKQIERHNLYTIVLNFIRNKKMDEIKDGFNLNDQELREKLNNSNFSKLKKYKLHRFLVEKMNVFIHDFRIFNYPLDLLEVIYTIFGEISSTKTKEEILEMYSKKIEDDFDRIMTKISNYNPFV